MEGEGGITIVHEAGDAFEKRGSKCLWVCIEGGGEGLR